MLEEGCELRGVKGGGLGLWVGRPAPSWRARADRRHTPGGERVENVEEGEDRENLCFLVGCTAVNTVWGCLESW